MLSTMAILGMSALIGVICSVAFVSLLLTILNVNPMNYIKL